ncbi:PAS domain-containing sensor histidine kinase [Nordella sp. HKS 07]|uniref:sensor histidine kinase n=1 Tax=Nordella sp. HKS 07 TaxID=2712222 RepID=UPI0013E11ABD|nr:PAS domain-containing sensor histidine kinase [Nordella sp. HKS 07]QIG46980.1 PAS domain-containing sensor histidine kinase [Nordella sp. HKS 07]
MGHRTGDASGPAFGGINSWSKFDFSKFRAEQIAPLAQFRPYVMGANALAVLIVIWSSLPATVGPWVYLWAVCQAGLTVTVLYHWFRDRNFASSNHRTIAAIEAASLAFAVLWAFPLLELLPELPIGAQHVVLAVCFIISVTGAFALTRLPLASITFTVVVSGALFVSQIRRGEDVDLLLGFIAVAVASLMSLMSVALYRTLVRRAADSYHLNRQSEFIALLLKDFEMCSSDLLWETDEAGKLTYFSDRLPTLLGTSTQLLGKTLEEAAGARPDDKGWQDFTQLTGNRQAIDGLRLEVRRPSITDWWMITAHPLWGHAQEFLGYRGVIRDISLERRAQLDLITAKEEAERASSAKSQFLAITSHELKTPLNAIVGFSEMLVAQHEGPLGSPVYAEYASTILQSSSHLRNIIADILDVTRIERGTLHLVEQDMDAAEILEIAYKMCRAQAKAADTPLAADLERTAEIQGDITRIRQVLINLVTNAIKFSEPGNAIALWIERLPDDGLAFVIEDHGIGIAPGDIERVFEAFEQGDASSSRRHGGLGLGLAIARKIARLHDGDVTLDSIKDEGTTARLILPATRVKWPEPLDTSDPETAGAASLAMK